MSRLKECNLSVFLLSRVALTPLRPGVGPSGENTEVLLHRIRTLRRDATANIPWLVGPEQRVSGERSQDLSANVPEGPVDFGSIRGI